MEKYTDRPLEKYISDLASNLPAPGGGSASAAVGALGVACLEMAANFTVNKKGYEEYQDEIKKILSELSDARSELLKLVDEDITAYENVSASYKYPKETDDEKKIRDEKIQDSIKNAMSVPLKICKITSSLMAAARRLLDISNKNLLTDVGCGTLFLKSAFSGAKLNVDINLKCLKDTVLINRTKTEVSEYLNKIKIADGILSLLIKQL
ncbi:MAG: cyclodeaminase/cyclohydrolase family protein [Elusimicrobiota bacterium]